MSALVTPCAPERPMQLFEELYGMLALLCPELRFGALRMGDNPELGLAVIEHSRYTTILSLHRGFGAPQIPELEMVVRVCHDARVAEVIAYQGCRRLPPPYSINGDSRYVRDERRQVNHLLRQLLWHRLATAVRCCKPSPEPDQV